LFFVIVFLCFSCKKNEDGFFFLRIIPPSDTLIQNLEVFDANGPVAVDGQYHLVSEWAEIKYILNEVLQSQILDWNSTMYFDEYSYYDENFHEFMGEFEKSDEDKYYTLTINYILEISDEPYYNQWVGYYYIFYRYYDRSSLTKSETP